MLVIIPSVSLQSYPYFTAVDTTSSGKGVIVLPAIMVSRVGTESGIESALTEAC